MTTDDRFTAWIARLNADVIHRNGCRRCERLSVEGRSCTIAWANVEAADAAHRAYAKACVAVGETPKLATWTGNGWGATMPTSR